LPPTLENVDNHFWLRPYQIETNAATEVAIDAHKRQMRGDGHWQDVYDRDQVNRLMKSGVAKRVLFLVDQRAIALCGVHIV
jgi:type I restriction enzyme R subunit